MILLVLGSACGPKEGMRRRVWELGREIRQAATLDRNM